MMSDEKEIYFGHASTYEQLITYEDYQGNILTAIQERVRLPVEHAVDLGAGTGRLARLLAPYARAVTALDLSTHMLAEASRALADFGYTNCRLAAADNRSLPLPAGCADLVVSGWSLCYLVAWDGAGWQTRVETALAEIRRILRPGGAVLIFETLGTGFETPHPPDHLKDYYAYLEAHGFQYAWLRTDYRFPSLPEAHDLAEAFFGPEMGRKVLENRWQVLPECTGLWWHGRR